MIEKALKYLTSLAAPTMTNVDGEMYSDKSLTRISFNPKASEITMNTLTSLVEYIKSGVDEMNGNMIVHVQSPTQVKLYSALDRERRRECLVDVCAQVPKFAFDQFIEHENFCINLQSKFIDTLDRALLLKFAGTVEAGSVAEYGDNGVAQKATIRTGIATKGDAIVPSSVALVPFRTFVEVEQPVSNFVFRMKQDERNGIYCALFEADGGAWKNYAMDNIKTCLKEQLKDVDGFVIIS